MAFSIAIDPAARRATITLSGSVSARTLYRALFDCVAHPDWMPGYAMVWDGRSIRHRTNSAVAAEHLIQSAADLALLLGPGRSAVIVRGRRDTVLARRLISQLRSMPREWDVFNSATVATRWLDVPVGRLRQRV